MCPKGLSVLVSRVQKVACLSFLEGWRVPGFVVTGASNSQTIVLCLGFFLFVLFLWQPNNGFMEDRIKQWRVSGRVAETVNRFREMLKLEI